MPDLIKNLTVIDHTLEQLIAENQRLQDALGQEQRRADLLEADLHQMDRLLTTLARTLER
jgi:hypothetical protein